MLQLAAYNFKAILEGSLSLLPGGDRLFTSGTTGTDSARYCYSVWLRHLVKIHCHHGAVPDGVVVELGPGDTLGIGLSALLSGASRYIAVDVVRHADVARNLAVLAELVELFGARAPIPGGEEFPEIKPELNHFAFPTAILDPERLEHSLAPVRVAAIAAALRGDVAPGEGGEPLVRYVDPSIAAREIATGSADLIFSQAVLEHVDDIAGAYRACHHWLVPGGLMSHQIDFKSHGASREWNGHWAYPEPVWWLLRGRRPYLLNREPCGAHLELMAAVGFELLAVERALRSSRLRRKQLASRFRGITEDDLTTAGAFIVARKDVGRGSPVVEAP